MNPANLELEELYNPQRLYTYLRNHHWKDQIPESYISEWSKMKISQYQLTEVDELDFQIILEKLGISYQFELNRPLKTGSTDLNVITTTITKFVSEKMPSLKNNWDEFKKWIFNKIDGLETLSKSKVHLNSDILTELLNILHLLNRDAKDTKEEIQRQTDKNFR